MAASRDRVAAEPAPGGDRLRLELWVRERRWTVRLSDLGFAPGHPRFWGGCPATSSLRDRGTAAADRGRRDASHPAVPAGRRGDRGAPCRCRSASRAEPDRLPGCRAAAADRARARRPGRSTRRSSWIANLATQHGHDLLGDCEYRSLPGADTTAAAAQVHAALRYRRGDADRRARRVPSRLAVARRRTRGAAAGVRAAGAPRVVALAVAWKPPEAGSARSATPPFGAVPRLRHSRAGTRRSACGGWTATMAAHTRWRWAEPRRRRTCPRGGARHRLRRAAVDLRAAPTHDLATLRPRRRHLLLPRRRRASARSPATGRRASAVRVARRRWVERRFGRASSSVDTLVAVQRALLRICAARGDVFAVLALPTLSRGRGRWRTHAPARDAGSTRRRGRTPELRRDLSPLARRLRRCEPPTATRARAAADGALTGLIAGRARSRAARGSRPPTSRSRGVVGADAGDCAGAWLDLRRRGSTSSARSRAGS